LQHFKIYLPKNRRHNRISLIYTKKCTKKYRK